MVATSSLVARGPFLRPHVCVDPYPLPDPVSGSSGGGNTVSLRCWREIPRSERGGSLVMCLSAA